MLLYMRRMLDRHCDVDKKIACCSLRLGHVSDGLAVHAVHVATVISRQECRLSCSENESYQRRRALGAVLGLVVPVHNVI
jgi:hypothetical protein